MAVIHFPCSSSSAGLVPDLNAEHESEPVVGGEYTQGRKTSARDARR